MDIIRKIKDKLAYTVIVPLPYTRELQRAYNGVSVAGGQLKDKNAVVTGATSGIGLAISRRLLMEGCKVTLVGRSRGKLGEVVSEFANVGLTNTDVELIDFLNYSDVVNKVNRLAQLKDIDIWVNCAGILKKKDRDPSFRSYDEKDFLDVINTNLKSTYIVSRMVADSMLKKNIKGSIINISSICGFSKKLGFTGYGMSKAGVIEMTRKLAGEYKNKLKIVSIAPGSVATRMGNKSLEDNIAVDGTMITKHIALPEEIASLSAFLCSNVGSYMNSETIIASADEML
jgi:3-oxoacyl-[acyl-carrier protein] reductase